MGASSFDPQLGRELRIARRRLALGSDPECRYCGCRLIPALMRQRGGVTCYECTNRRRGLPTTEVDHTLGHEFPTLIREQPANYHRLLSDVDIAPEARFFEYFYERDLIRRLRGG